MMFSFKSAIFAGLIFVLNADCICQNYIRPDYILYQKHLVRSVNLKSAGNKSLFLENDKSILSRILLEAFAKGTLEAYENETFNRKINQSQLNEKLQYYISEDSLSVYAFDEVHDLEIGEDLVFDKHRSEFVWIPYSLTLFIPEELNHRGLLEPLICFKFSDCMKIFSNDKRAKGKNPFNEAQLLEYKEIFLIRIYEQQIVKIGNPDSPYFDQLYFSPATSFIARKKEEEKIMEFAYKIFNPK